MVSREIFLTKWMPWVVIGLGIVCVFTALFVLLPKKYPLEARLLPSHLRGEIPWKTIFAEDVRVGTSVPADTNVIIHIPEDIPRITRKTLFGRRGDTVRYWGYCFPENYDEALKLKKQGFPGLLFLSEAERQVRIEKERAARRERFSIFKNLTEEDLNESYDTRNRIRHQMEIFEPGVTCYVMTAEPLPIGIDRDNDGVNEIIEHEWGSDPEVKDSDGDGLTDDTEIFIMKSNPTIRDSDGDGILDGIEDANKNGYVELGETDPLNRDSDRDGLCDGLCRAGKKGAELRGEDVNLNGIVDGGEMDPRKNDSNGDGILDEQEYFNCMLQTEADCNYSINTVQ